MRHSFTLCYLMLFCWKSYAQCDFEKQKEIKLSGNFYYGEYLDKDTSKTRISARTELMQQIANAYLEKQISFPANDTTIYVNNILYCLSQYGTKYKCIAFLPKSQIIFKQKQQNELKVFSMNFSDSVGNAGNNEDGINKQLTKENNLIDSLKFYKELKNIEIFLITYSRKNKLAYTNKESLVKNATECYIFVIDKMSKTLVACLGKGSTSRVDLISKKTIGEYSKQFQNSDFIWVYVY